MIVSASLYRMFLACFWWGRPTRGTCCLFLNQCKSRPGADTSCCKLDLTKRSSLLHMAKESYPPLKIRAIFRNKLHSWNCFNFHLKRQTAWLGKRKKYSRLQGHCELCKRKPDEIASCGADRILSWQHQYANHYRLTKSHCPRAAHNNHVNFT